MLYYIDGMYTLVIKGQFDVVPDFMKAMVNSKLTAMTGQVAEFEVTPEGVKIHVVDHSMGASETLKTTLEQIRDNWNGGEK